MIIIIYINDCWAYVTRTRGSQHATKKEVRLLPTGQKNLFGELVSSTTVQEDGHVSEETSKRRRCDMDSWHTFAM